MHLKVAAREWRKPFSLLQPDNYSIFIKVQETDGASQPQPPSLLRHGLTIALLRRTPVKVSHRRSVKRWHHRNLHRPQLLARHDCPHGVTLVRAAWSEFGPRQGARLASDLATYIGLSAQYTRDCPFALHFRLSAPLPLGARCTVSIGCLQPRRSSRHAVTSG